ncbi:hypothetical protein [Anaeromyxobacter diazotrophicus]|uniref:Alginate export domain-containing protein n=1 Tax=Anaeromyxobacter diazotrophicus TaxID=2590199 RepID=A0A7I9VLW5_9BACT|nr:hypothetical protein [Anaeromyxobacter diazotrophicus]GEJ57402.1 hypothetical protein AMYX_21430 [Anaeromyxobacter diazotrophicus]
MRATAVAVLSLLVSAAGARADDGDLRFSLVLHGRYTDRENLPSPSLLFDPARQAFAAGPYLRPQGSDAYPSALVSAGAEGRQGALRWALQADTGELRGQAFPARAEVCFATLASSPTGLAQRGSGKCNVFVNGRLPAFALDEVRLMPAQLASNGRPFEDELRGTLLLRQAWVGAVLGRNDFALVRVGRKRFTVADGFVHDDWGTGAEATFDLGALGPSWELGASLFYPSRDLPSGAGWSSALLAVRADYLPSLFEHAGLFAAFFRDRSSELVELFRGSLSEPGAVRLAGLAPGTPAFAYESRLVALQLDRPFTGDADVGWAGTSGSLSLGRVKLDWTAALAFGQLTIPDVTLTELSPTLVRTATRYRTNALFGQLAHLRVAAPVGDAWRFGGFFLYLSGDAPPAEKARLGEPARYGGFLGVAPFITDTNIFFNGGVAETFAARQATAPGVNARGVIAPGLNASWEPAPAFGVDARAAYLVAPVAGPFGGRVYGPEADLELTWSPAGWLTLLAEADALFPGDFFAGRATITKVVVGCDVVAF